jgi:tetratricopeptide (TPR) repeat protein
MFEAAEPFEVRFLEYFAVLGRRYAMSLKPSKAKPNPKKIELARIKVEQAMREIVDGQSEFAETFINAAYSDEPGTVVWGLAMTVWASAGPMGQADLRARGKSILDLAAKKRPAHRLLIRAHMLIAKNERKFNRAHGFLDMMLRLDTKDVEAIDDRIKLYMLQEDYQKAAEILHKALMKWPENEGLQETQVQFKDESKQCFHCGTYMRAEAPFCPKCKHSFL